MLDQDQYWLGHLKAIDASGTTTKAYGKLNGLNVQKLYGGGKKFKTRQGPGGLVVAQGCIEENPFVAVQVKTESSMVAIAPAEAPSGCVVRCGALRLEFGGLPPVSWLVSLAQAARVCRCD